MATIVERATTFMRLVPLPIDRKAHIMRDAIASKVIEVPEQLPRTLTGDKGREMAVHADFKFTTDDAAYPCDTHSPGSADPTSNRTLG